MGHLYGQVVRILTAIIGVIKTVALVAAQFKVGMNVSLLLFPEIKEFAAFSTMIIGLLVILYSTFGGARAVALTDVYQFFLFGVCFPILICTFLYHAQPSTHWKSFMMMPQFDPVTVCTWNNTLKDALATFIWHTVFPFDPARVQRIYMASSVQQAAKVFLISAVIRIIFPLLFLTIVASLYIGGHTINPGQDVLDYVIRLAYFPGIKGLLVTDIIALLMSTADSNLHAASVLCVNDLWPFLFRSNRIFRSPSLTTVRITCSLIGLISVFCVLYTTSVLQLLNKSTLFYTSVITVPFIVSCFGFRPSSAAVLCTMGISTAITAYHIFIKVQPIGQKDIFKSLLLSSLVLLVMHRLLPKQPGKGWVGIQDYSAVELQNQENKRWWVRKLYYFQSIFTPSYWKDIFPKNAITFIASGIYFIIYSSILLCYVEQVYEFSYIHWYISAMSIGTIVTLYPTFHTYKQGGNRFLHGLWPILLCTVLCITGITYMKLSHFSPISCAFFIVNIGLSSLLLPYTIMIFMLFTSLFIHRWIPPYLSLISYKELITIETMIGLTILLSCLVYRYLRNKNHIQLQTIALTRSYEQQYALASLHNQANWNRLDPTYSGKVLQDMANALEPYVKNLPIQQHQKKLYVFSQSLLQRAKEERTFTLDSKSICYVMLHLG
ncbi:sodium:solute symporter family protein [Cardinium endosymbiont of Nabis limbatus]|uniref:sodium:solute symporter family protein n=1 Tax=Cardinium endosymbiont of Nabis limbatus TaxID=3066217 RepID=UPI003AF33DB8